MTLNDCLREYDHDVRDALAAVQRRLEDLSMARNAAEERVKRTSTQITEARESEGRQKHDLASLDGQLTQVKAELDELERRRQDLFTQLLGRREEREKTGQRLRMAQNETEEAHGTLRSAMADRDRAQRELVQAEEELGRHRTRLGAAHVSAVNAYIAHVAKSIESAFVGEDERRQRAAVAKRFKQARHEDRTVADLYDQREQYRQLIALATVPGVRSSLDAMLREIEGKLEALFPGAITATDEKPLPATVQELHYFVDGDGRCCVLLPILESTWRGIAEGDTSREAKQAMLVVFNLISGAKLKGTDGEFTVAGGRCIFRGEFAPEDVAALGPFRLQPDAAAPIDFRFEPLPSEVQEALS